MLNLNLINTGQKYAYLKVPASLYGNMTFTSGQNAEVTTTISVLYNEVSLLGTILGSTGLLGILVGILNTIIELGDLILGDILADLTALSTLLDKLVQEVKLTEIQFSVPYEDLIASDGYLAVPLDEETGTVVVDDLRNLLVELGIALTTLASSGLAIILSPLTAALGDLLIAIVYLLVGANLGELINQIADAAVLGITIVDMPVTVSSHVLSTDNGLTDANLHASIIQSDLIDIDLFSNESDYATIYLGNTVPITPSDVIIDGNSKDDYTVSGEGTPGDTVIVTDKDGNELGTTTVNPGGSFEVEIEGTLVTEGETLEVVSDKDGVSSTPLEVVAPQDPTLDSNESTDLSGGNETVNTNVEVLPNTGVSKISNIISMLLIAIGCVLLLINKNKYLIA